MARLVAAAGEQLDPIELERRTTLGRDAANAVVLPDPMVSGRHAEIVRGEDGAFRIVDLGSRHGTFVAGKRVNEAVLRHGDEILIGIHLLRFEGAENDDQPAAVVQRRMPLVPDQFPPAREYASIEDLARDYEKLRAGFELARAIGVERGLPALLGRILDTAFRLLPAERGTVQLLDPEGGAPIEKIERRRSGEPEAIDVSRSIVAEVTSTRSGVIASDAVTDARFQRSASISAQGIRSAMCVPMLYDGELLGIMYLDSQLATGAFEEKDLALFATIATQAALAVKSVLLLRQIEQERLRLERIVESLPHGVLLLAPDRRVVHENARAGEMLERFGVKRNGEPLRRLGTWPIDQLLGYEGEEIAEVVVPGARKRILAASAWSVRNAPGEQRETVLVLRDVTDERLREQREARQERLTLLGQLAGGISHDFSNLLSVILNYAEFIESDAANAQQRADIAQVRAAAARAAQLTSQLLAFSRREVVKPRVLDLNALVRDAQGLLRRTLNERIELETELAADLRHIKGDPTKLEQVLVNLVVNARDAMPAGGKLVIGTSNLDLAPRVATREELQPGPYVVLAVSDTGTGMAPDVMARVFEPFFTTKDKGRGTGLGLATVYGVVKQSGGTIWIESEPGKGSTFRVVLPATDEELLPAGLEPADVALPFPAGTVLIVEDDPHVLDGACRLLRRAGLTVLEAASAENALQVAGRYHGRIDVLLTDVVLPGRSGKDLASALKEQRPELQVVFMSGYVAEAQPVALEAGSPLLTKPFTRQELFVAIRGAMKKEPAGGSG